MLIAAIRTGRYTYEKRTKDTIELRQLEQEKSQVLPSEISIKTSENVDIQHEPKEDDIDLDDVIAILTATHLTMVPCKQEFHSKLKEWETTAIVRFYLRSRNLCDYKCIQYYYKVQLF